VIRVGSFVFYCSFVVAAPLPRCLAVPRPGSLLPTLIYIAGRSERRPFDSNHGERGSMPAGIA
jgi:hypothetical protein